MQSEWDAPSSSALYQGLERGAGGKLRKPPARKPPVSPYARPPSNLPSQRKSGGWLSKVVGGAARLLPSFLSGSSTSFAWFSPSTNEDQDNRSAELKPDAQNSGEDGLKVEVSRSLEERGPSSEANRLKENSENDDGTTSSDDSELAKIENLMKGKRFSRDEINRLTEILNSRVVDVCDVQRKLKTSPTASLVQAKGISLDNENPKTLIKEKHGALERSLLESPTPFASNMQDEVAASPVDIARAYMGSRTPVIGPSSYSMAYTDEGTPQQNDVFLSKPYIPTPSPKSSTFWPGAIVQRGYFTPQSQRGRYGLYNFPRTPYSRSMYSKSKLTPIQADSRSLNNASSLFQQSRTPSYVKTKLGANSSSSAYGSVGPIRRIRNKLPPEPLPRVLSVASSSQKAPEGLENARNSPGVFSFLETSFENYKTVGHVEQTSEGTTHTVSSNQITRRILEQLDRHKPTPKEKAAELKLATSWKQSPSEDINVTDFPGSDSLNRADFSKQKFPTRERGGSGSILVKLADSSIVSDKVSGMLTGDGGGKGDTDAGPSLGLRSAYGSEINSKDKKARDGTTGEGKGTSQLRPQNNQSNGEDHTRLPPLFSSGTDPLKKRASQSGLKPISFKRPDPQRIVSSDNGPGFTFPLYASVGLSSEPPTPSIMPSFPVSSLPQSKEMPAVPTFSFGQNQSSARLAFSFPSTSSVSNDGDSTPDIKFEFGLGKKSRVSFASVAI